MGNYGKGEGTHQRECEHRGRGWRREEGSELERKGSGRSGLSAPWEMTVIPHSLFITSRKSAQKKEQITVLNIEGPQRSRTILEREQQGGEEEVLCTSEEMKGRTNNIVLKRLRPALWAPSSDQPHPSDPEPFIVRFSKEKNKSGSGQNSQGYPISQETEAK